MTNQQLKAHCEDVIANPQDHLDWVVDMARVALASLDAVPVVEVTKWTPLGIDGGVSKFLQPVGNLPDFGSFLYTAPPAPELKAIECPAFDDYVPHIAKELQGAFKNAVIRAGYEVKS